jgi:hypothetical protein
MTTGTREFISDRLKQLSRELNATYAEILTQFFIERAVVRLVSNPVLYEHLIFKGGFVGLRVYGSPRFTTDLDAVTHRLDRIEVIRLAKEAMEKPTIDHVWFVFEREIELVTQSEYGGTRLQYRVGLGIPPSESRRSQIFNLDIGTGDPVTPGPKRENTRTTLGDGDISWRIYPIETIIAEKLHPLAKLGRDNSRSKDIFDLAFYLPNASSDILRKAIEKTFTYRGDELPASFSAFLETLDRRMLRRGWKAATANIQPTPDFDEAFETVVARLRSMSI